MTQEKRTEKDMTSLAVQKCTACDVNATPVVEKDRATLLRELHPDWCIQNIDDIPQLCRIYSFTDFASALAFVVHVGAIAEQADHHPTMTVTWGKVTVCWWTHKIRDLHHNDFILSARCDAAYLR